MSTEYSFDDLKNKGNAAFQSGQYEDAVEHYTAAINLNSQNEIIFSNRSGAYASLSKFDLALQDAEECLRLNPNFPKGYGRKGYALLKLNKLAEAQEVYQQGLNLFPENEALKKGLHECKDNTPDPNEMQMLMNALTAARQNPKIQQYIREDPSYLEKLLGCVKGLSKSPEAIMNAFSNTDPRIREGIMIIMGLNLGEQENQHPGEAYPFTDTNQNQFTHGSDEKSTEHESTSKSTSTPKTQTTAEKMEKPQDELLKEKGNRLYKEKKFQEALECYEEAIKINPGELLYYNNQAAVYVEMGEYEKAIKLCEETLEKKVDGHMDFKVAAKIYNRLGNIYTKTKNYNKAIEMYEKSLLESNERTVRSSLQEIKRMKDKAEKAAYVNPEIAEEERVKGNELFKSCKYAEAKAVYDEAIKRNPEDAKLYGNRAATYMKLLEYPLALKDADKSVELNPRVAKAWARKGVIHNFLKEYNKAMEAFDKGLKEDPDSVDCYNGRINTISKIQASQSSDQVDEDQVRRAMADPEVQAIMKDPQFQIVLKNLTENPQSINEYLKDPHIAQGIQKLIGAGIIRTS